MIQVNSLARVGGMLRSARITANQRVTATFTKEAHLCQRPIVQTDRLEVSVAVWDGKTVERSGILRSMEAGGT